MLVKLEVGHVLGDALVLASFDSCFEVCMGQDNAQQLQEGQDGDRSTYRNFVSCVHQVRFHCDGCNAPRH